MCPPRREPADSRMTGRSAIFHSYERMMPWTREPTSFQHGELFSAGQRLYAAAPDGLEIWDPFTGHRTGRIPGFGPTHHHPTAGELVMIQEGALLRWTL